MALGRCCEPDRHMPAFAASGGESKDLEFPYIRGSLVIGCSKPRLLAVTAPFRSLLLAIRHFHHQMPIFTVPTIQGVCRSVKLWVAFYSRHSNGEDARKRC